MSTKKVARSLVTVVLSLATTLAPASAQFSGRTLGKLYSTGLAIDRRWFATVRVGSVLREGHPTVTQTDALLAQH